MNRNIYFTLFLICSSFLCNAQIFQKTFNNNNGDDDGSNIVKTLSGEYYLSATISNYPVSQLDLGIIKLNSIGDTLWTKMYGGPSIDYSGIFLDGNQPYFTGSTGNPSFGEYDIVFAKISSSNGDTLWTKRYGTSLTEVGMGICKTLDGGFLISGVRNILFNPPWNWVLIKTNAQGDTLWTKEYDGGNDENRFSILQLDNGGYLLCGSTTSFGAGDYDVEVCKLDANGNPLTCKTIGGSLFDNFIDIRRCTGGYIILGITYSWGAGNSDVMLTKIDTNLNIVWSKAFGTSTDDQGYALEVTSEGDFVVAGRIGLTSSSDWASYLIKTDLSGNLIWSKKYSASINQDYAQGVIETSNKGYLLNCSTTNSSTGVDIYLIKTDSMGNSGCNQQDVTTITTDITSLLQIGTGTLTVSNPGIMVANWPVNMWSGLHEDTLCYSGVGIKEEYINKNDIMIYPNPTSYIINLKFVSESDYAIQLIDLSGRILLTKKITKSNSIEENTIDVSLLQNGIYYLMLRNEKENWVRKIVVQH